MGMLDEGVERPCAAAPVRPSFPLVLGCALLVWLVAIVAFYATFDADRALPDALSAGRWTFELLDDAKQGDYGLSAPARATRDGASFDVLVLYDDGPRFMAHECFEAYAVFETFSEANALRFAQQGLVADADVRGAATPIEPGAFAPIVEVRRWASELFEGRQGRGAALLRALVTGDRVDLERDGLYDDMKAIGLAHMVAVSGSHLSVVAALVGFVLEKLGAKRQVCVVVLCLFYGAYSLFTGLSAPVIRAAVMSSVVVSAVWAHRRSSALAALSVCVCVLIGLHPQNALSLSFFLSAASTFGVVLFAPLFSSWASAACAGRAKAATDACALTFAAGLPILPVSAAVFARYSIVAPVANMLAAPIFTVFLVGTLAVLPLCGIVPQIGGVALDVLSRAADVCCAAAEVLAGVPYASVPLSGDVYVVGALTIAAVAALWAAWPRPSGRTVRVCAACALALCVGFGMAIPRAAADEVVMLDVGQGDAFLVRSQGASLLVDTGNQEAKLFSALGRQGVASVDAVAISHHDDDHCGCLDLLGPNIKRGVLVAEETFSCPCEDCAQLLEDARATVGEGAVEGLAAGDVVHVGRFDCTVVWPRKFEEEGGNADSLCFLVEYDAQGDGDAESSMLLTGDAEAEQIRAMLDEAGLERVDVLKAGHHGSKAGVDDGFAQRVGAQAALISCGTHNRYGHPAPETLEEFEEAGMRVFRTDEQGDVVCRFSGEQIAFYPQRG